MKVSQSCPTLWNPMDYTVHGIVQARILKWIAFLSPGDLPNPGIKPRSPALQVDSLPAEPPWEPTNTGAGSLSLLQQIFLIQGLNQGLLHCRNNVKRWSILSYLLLFGHFESKSFAAPQTVARHAPLSMGFRRQEYWSGSHSLLQGIFPTQGSNPYLLLDRQILYNWGTTLSYTSAILSRDCHSLL